MSARLPYELQLQQQWIDLPLPDENLAWADMKRRLEEDDDRPVIAWWKRGCALWIGLGLIALIAIWWWLRPEQWFISESTTKQELSIEPTNKKNTAVPNKGIKTPGNTDGSTPQQKGNTPSSGNTGEVTSNATTKTDDPSTAKPISDDPDPVNNTPVTSSSLTSGGGGISGRRQTISRTNANQQQPGTSKPVSGNTKPTQSVNSQPVPIGNNAVVSPADSNKISKNNSVTPPESSIAKTDSVKKKDTTTTKPPVASTPKTDSAKKKNIFFSAGIAMHQQIPMAGQKFTPYSASGRKFSLADYIPSIYFRVNKETNNKDKWFIQGEFRYGAPNYTKELLYRDQTKRDSAGPNTTAYIVNTKLTVKKTFYHQLPITFNYYILSDLSIGAGVAWNKFSSALVDRQRTARNTITLQDSSFPDNGFIKIKNDSAFSNSYFQAILESHYKWKRFSLGARYMFGLQPFLKFQVPGGTSKEKNSSLQLFIRYELWRSKKR